MLAPSAHRVLDRITQPPATLLDVGAGTGSLTLAAAARWPDARVLAVDASRAMLDIARRRAEVAWPRGASRFEWLVADAADLSLADGSVDAAVSSFVLQKVADRGAVLRALRRVLRPGGVFAFVTWLADELIVDADGPYDAALAASGFPPEPAAFRLPGEGDYRSLDEARADLLHAGFTRVEVWSERAALELVAGGLPGVQGSATRTTSASIELAADERGRLRDRILAAWADLPEAAFELRTPLVAGTAIAPAGPRPS